MHSWGGPAECAGPLGGLGGEEIGDIWKEHVSLDLTHQLPCKQGAADSKRFTHSTGPGKGTKGLEARSQKGDFILEVLGFILEALGLHF